MGSGYHNGGDSATGQVGPHEKNKLVPLQKAEHKGICDTLYDSGIPPVQLRLEIAVNIPDVCKTIMTAFEDKRLSEGKRKGGNDQLPLG